MKKLSQLLLLFFLCTTINLLAQVTELADVNFKAINIGNHGQGDYTKSIILLHEMYNGTKIGKNYAVGKITAMRGTPGAFNRTNVVNVNTSSAYTNNHGSITSLNTDATWKLITVMYNNKKYMAIHVPYSAAWHHLGFQFEGWTQSTAENMKVIPYEKSGNVLNAEVANSIQDFTPNMIEYHDVAKLILNGKMGIGTTDLGAETLTVKSTVNIGGKGNGSLKVRHVNGKAADSDAFSSLYLNYGTGTDVVIGKNDKKSDLLVYGDAFVGNLSTRRYLKIASKEWPEIRFQTPTSDREMRLGVAHGVYSNYGTEEGDLYVYSATSNSMPFIVRRNADIALGLKKGNVGIGTNETHGFKLGVKGRIAATEVKVALHDNWADFVFYDDYKLPTLTEVENHIQAKGHLKDIPSAKEVAENGIFLGDMNAKLLQKIEELTLYTIQQEKKLEKQNSEIELLKKQEDKIKKLEEENKVLKSLLERVEKLEKATK